MSKIIIKHVSEVEYENPIINISIPLPVNKATVILSFTCQSCNGYGDSQGGVCRTCNGTSRESKILNLENIRIALGEDETEKVIEIIDDISKEMVMS